jgi:hypothetical protein
VLRAAAVPEVRCTRGQRGERKRENAGCGSFESSNDMPMQGGQQTQKPIKLKKNHGFEPKNPLRLVELLYHKPKNPWAVEKPIEHVFP